jgi:hypothetical protein
MPPTDTDTDTDEAAPSARGGASRSATVVAAAEVRGEWGSRTLPTLVRNVIRAALRKPAVADFVGEHIFDITSGDEPPAAVGDALRLALNEVLAATTSEDWAQVASDLLAYARECIEDGDSAAPITTIGTIDSFGEERDCEDWLLTLEVDGSGFVQFSRRHFVHAVEDGYCGELRVRQGAGTTIVWLDID